MAMRQSYAVKVAAMKEKDKSPEYHRENNKGQVTIVVMSLTSWLAPDSPSSCAHWNGCCLI